MAENKKSIGLTRAVIIASTATTAVTLVLVAVIGFIASFTRVNEGVIASSEQALGVYAKQVDDWLVLQADFAQSQANAAGNLVVAAGGRAHNDDFIDSVMLLNEALLDCYTAYNDVELFMAVTDVNGLPAGFDATTRSWYKAAVSNKKPIYTAPYIDTATGAMIITVAAPIYENGVITGVFGCDITLDYIMELVKSMKLSENGYPVLIDGEGNFMVHGNNEFNPRISGGDAVITSAGEVGGDYTAVMKNSAKDTYFGLNGDYDGQQRYFAFSSLPSAGWTIGYVMPQGDVNGSLTGLAVTYVVLLIAALAISTIIMIYVTKVQMKPLARINEVSRRIAAGDLSADFDYSASDEIGLLADSIKLQCNETKQIISDLSYILSELEHGNLAVKSRNAGIYKGDYAEILSSIEHFVDDLNRTLSEINSASERVLASSEQVSSNAQALSQGTSDQAASIQELSATIQTVSGQINDNAGFSKEAMEQTNMSGGEMNRAMDSMNALVAAMVDIRECSDKIGAIIKTIEDISFQTNILSLNASVEAARAGEAGKGFAVVADEVRNLAGKSAEASARTNELIANTVSAIERGNTLVSEVAAVMADVGESSGRCAGLNTKICEVSEESVLSITQISTGVDRISGVVQTTAATAEQSASSAEELSTQANTLKELVSQFKLV